MVTTYDPLSAPDGIAIDRNDAVYVAVNVLGRSDRVTEDGSSSIFAADMMTPASIAFGDAPGFDPCSMYVTSLFGQDVYQVTAGIVGLPLLQ